jgi:hypothetical protein
MAMSCFTMAFITDGVMGLVSKAVTKDWPGGLAYLVVQGLMKKYRPVDTISKVEMRQQRNHITMKRGLDPALLFEQLSYIEEFKLIGDLIGSIKMDDTDKQNRVKIEDMSYLPNGKFNLFSLTQLMSKGWSLEGNMDGLKLRKGNQVLTFDIKIPTPKGILFGIQIKRDGEMICSGSNGKVKVDIQEAHSKLGHISIAGTRKVAQSISWDLTGKVKPCEACAVGKVQHQNIVKKSNHKIAENIGQHVFINLTSVKNTEFLDIEHSPKPYWRIIVDETTQMKLSDFFETKIGMVEPTLQDI